MDTTNYLITRVTPFSWDVYNESNQTRYRVDKRKSYYECNCPHWYYRLRVWKGKCKHIVMVAKNGGWNEQKTS